MGEKIRKKRDRSGLLSGRVREGGSQAKLENLITITDIQARGPWELMIPFPALKKVTCHAAEIPMSTLAKDAAAFKSALARQDYTSWHSNPAPPQPPGDAGGEEPVEKKKKKKAKNSTCRFLSPPDARFECPSFRCRVFATGGYWYGE